MKEKGIIYEIDDKRRLIYIINKWKLKKRYVDNVERYSKEELEVKQEQEQMQGEKQ